MSNYYVKFPWSTSRTYGKDLFFMQVAGGQLQIVCAYNTYLDEPTYLDVKSTNFEFTDGLEPATVFTLNNLGEVIEEDNPAVVDVNIFECSVVKTSKEILEHIPFFSGNMVKINPALLDDDDLMEVTDDKFEKALEEAVTDDDDS
jgi:hypothetical protein